MYEYKKSNLTSLIKGFYYLKAHQIFYFAIYSTSKYLFILNNHKLIRTGDNLIESLPYIKSISLFSLQVAFLIYISCWHYLLN